LVGSQNQWKIQPFQITFIFFYFNSIKKVKFNKVPFAAALFAFCAMPPSFGKIFVNKIPRN
jgi:hypothetical protein